MFGQQNIEKLEAADQFGDLNIELINRQSLRIDQPKLVENRTKLTHPHHLSHPTRPSKAGPEPKPLPQPRLEANLQTRCDKNV
jgi:hypothetical protein